MTLELHGVHHLTAVTSDVSANHAFYTEQLGMRLVKKTVNQDDVGAYHLFYADGAASPGSDLTFFDWPTIPRERRGSHTITRTGLRVTGLEALVWWEDRLASAGIEQSGIVKRDGRSIIEFADAEGQRLWLIDDDGSGDGVPWAGSPVPQAYQIRGLGPIEITLSRLAPTDTLLTQVMGMRLERTYPHHEDSSGTVHVFGMGPGGPAAELHIVVRPDLPIGQPGAGGVHHVAFRVPDDEQYDAWLEHLARYGIQTSGPVDRFYFRSIYFREPNGILFELATDGPGFAVDEPAESLGERLALPPFLEPRRETIEANLKPL